MTNIIPPDVLFPDAAARYDRHLIERARNLADCDSPADLAAWITARYGYLVSADTAYAAGFGHAATIIRELASMAERQASALAALRNAADGTR